MAKEHVVRQYVEFLTKFGTDLESVNQIYQNLAKINAVQPVAIHFVPSEDISLADLVVTDNEGMRKVLLVLAYLVQVMDSLVEEAKPFYYTVLYYGEAVDETRMQQGECHTCAGQMVPVLHDLLRYVERCCSVVSNLMQQLSRIYVSAENGPKFLDVGDTHFKVRETCLRLQPIDQVCQLN